MFVCRSSALPEDPTFPHDLKKLGGFITPDNRVRSRKYREEPCQLRITNNERYNTVYREALWSCLRDEVVKQSISLGLVPLYLPHLSTEKPYAQEQQMKILTTEQSALQKKKRVIVVMNEGKQDLGIWSYRILGNDNIDAGSCVSLVKELDKRGEAYEAPGLIVMNPGQLCYSYRLGQSMTNSSWEALPRQSAVHRPGQETS